MLVIIVSSKYQKPFQTHQGVFTFFKRSKYKNVSESHVCKSHVCKESQEGGTSVLTFLLGLNNNIIIIIIMNIMAIVDFIRYSIFTYRTQVFLYSTLNTRLTVDGGGRYSPHANISHSSMASTIHV